MSFPTPEVVAGRANVHVKLKQLKARYEANEASRPEFDSEKQFTMTKTVKPDWKPGDGASDDDWTKHSKITIDPLSPSISGMEAYKLLISAIVPRPIAFLSTLSADGKTANLAPYSYFEVLANDPPTFVVSVSQGMKDTLKNLLETKEGVLNVISEWFIDAANYTSVDAPPGVSEWELSGLHKEPSKFVKPACVAESAFNIEVKLVNSFEIESLRTPGTIVSHICILQGLCFHAREDVLNKDSTTLDLAKLKPVGRAGGITYLRASDGFEVPRYSYAQQCEDVPGVKDLGK
ncbi:hypothetical protein BZA70DRAFT_268015 [Myxozyma melibiosi]|uniref:Flavin reductase like domain-containing protein n=1 Tax=Myxozyma melibiosi TaxID=54550 RepID=A0ABR1F4S7_9ASCO